MGSKSWASSKYELEGSLDVSICGLQRPQHQLLILDPHVPELLHLGLPAALAEQKHIQRLLSKDHLHREYKNTPLCPHRGSALTLYHLAVIPHRLDIIKSFYKVSPVKQTC